MADKKALQKSLKQVNDILIDLTDQKEALLIEQDRLQNMINDRAKGNSASQVATSLENDSSAQQFNAMQVLNSMASGSTN